jgi:hypothetical protein
MPCARLSKSSTERRLRSEVVVAVRQRNDSGAKVALSPFRLRAPHAISPARGLAKRGDGRLSEGFTLARLL